MSDILLVDDNDDLAELSAMVLEHHGHHVRRAVDGEDGLRRLHEGEPPDVIVLDVEMPRLTGPEMAYRVFVRDAGYERIPIVLVSGVVGLRDVARRVGTPYFVAKPVSADTLSSVVERALRERRPPRPSVSIGAYD